MKLNKFFLVFVFMLVLVVNIAFSKEPNLVKVNIQEIDTIKCYNMEKIMNSVYFNETLSESFYKFFINKFPSKEEVIPFTIYDPSNDYITRQNDYFSLRLKDQNETLFVFKTDGQWWWLSAETDINLSDYEDIKDKYDLIKREMRNLREYSIESIYRDFLNSYFKAGITYCSLSSGNSGREVALSIFNIYKKDISKLGCKFDESSYLVDCKTSELYSKLTENSFIWNYKEIRNKVEYKSGFNLLFLDKNDIRIKGEKYDDYPLYGNEIVISESDFSGGLDNGQAVFIDQIEYVKQLNEIPKLISEIDNFNNDILLYTNSLRNGFDDIKKIISDNNSLENKKERINNLVGYRLNYNKLKEDKEKIQKYKEIIKQKEEIIHKNKNVFYEDYYTKMASEYLTDLNFAFNDLEINFNNHEKEFLDLRDYIDTKNILLQSEIEAKSTAKNTEKQLFYAKWALIFTLFFTIVQILITERKENNYTKFILNFTKNQYKNIKKFLKKE